MTTEHGAPKGQAEGHRPDPSAREMDVLERITRANLVVSELCDGTRRWTMSIPVRPDDDADIVIGRALHESTKEITSLRAQLAAAEGQARGSEAMLIQAQRDCDNAQNAELVALSQLAERDAQVERMKEQKDGAYLERNQVVAALASCFPSGVARTAIEGWSEDWHGCVYIDLPTGQASWHYHDSQAFLFAHLPPYTKRWDGHTTPEKYQRLAALATGPRATAEAYGCAPNAKHIDEPHEPIPDRAFVRVGETEWEYNATYEFWRNVLRKGSNAYSEHAEAISVLYHAQRENAALREENERLRRSR